MRVSWLGLQTDSWAFSVSRGPPATEALAGMCLWLTFTLPGSARGKHLVATSGFPENVPEGLGGEARDLCSLLPNVHLSTANHTVATTKTHPMSLGACKCRPRAHQPCGLHLTLFLSLLLNEGHFCFMFSFLRSWTFQERFL